MLSDEMNLTNGKPLSMAIVAARAVVPLPIGPVRRHDMRGVFSLLVSCGSDSIHRMREASRHTDRQNCCWWVIIAIASTVHCHDHHCHHHRHH